MKDAKDAGFLSRKLNGMGHAAWPDRMFLHHGRVFFVEFKRPSGVLTPLQFHMHKLLREHHMDVYTVRARDEMAMVLRSQASRCRQHGYHVGEIFKR